MKIVHGYQWFRGQKRLTEVWPEEKAKECHESRILHTAVCYRDEEPYCFVTFNGDYVGVGLLDPCRREAVQLQFIELEPKKLFLGLAIFREFVGDTDKVAKATFYKFKPEGSVRIEKNNLLSMSTEVAEGPQDVSANWEPYPEFGQYDSIIRRER